MDRCKELGVDHLVDAVVGNINNKLPFEDNTFDGCFSCEVLCHAGDKEFTLTEVMRVLKPGGVMVFSDLMGADDADEEALRSFTDRNATTIMGRPSQYLAAIKASGMKYVCWWDNSNHLEKYFRQMLRQISPPRGHEGCWHHGCLPRQLGAVPHRPRGHPGLQGCLFARLLCLPQGLGAWLTDHCRPSTAA